MNNSLQADISLLEIHSKNTINGEQLDYLESLPHVLLIGLFRRIYFDDNMCLEIGRKLQNAK